MKKVSAAGPREPPPPLPRPQCADDEGSFASYIINYFVHVIIMY